MLRAVGAQGARGQGRAAGDVRGVPGVSEWRGIDEEAKAHLDEWMTDEMGVLDEMRVSEIDEMYLDVLRVLLRRAVAQGYTTGARAYANDWDSGEIAIEAGAIARGEEEA